MINCSNCNSTKVVYSGALMHGRKKMAKLRCEECGSNTFMGWDVYQDLNPDIKPTDKPAYTAKPNISSERKKIVVTCAVIGHKINSKFLESLESYCNFNDADLVVIPIKYKNADAIFDEDNLATQYYTIANFEFGDNYKIMGGLKLNASMEHPLSGLDPLSKGKSLIFGHPQVALKTVPSDGKYPSIISTTGCVSEKFYTDTKQGLKAGFNHSYSAVVLETDSDGDTHIRHLNFDGEGFWDIENYYSGFEVTGLSGSLIPALVTGDEHVLFQDESVVKATYTNPDSILNVLRPELIVRHDVLDSYSISHHHKKNVFTKFAKFKEGISSLEDELDKTVAFIVETTPYYSMSVIVSSNHNDHLTQWLNECDPTIEPWNAELYHWFMWRMLSETSMGESGSESPNPFELYVRELYLDKDSASDCMEFIGRNESYTVGEVSIQHHGDKGVNGSRGSRSQFSKLPTKNIIGHSHSPGIDKGSYQVGTSSKLRLEYNNGPSGWHHCHALIYPNGKRQLIFITNGKWRA